MSVKHKAFWTVTLVAALALSGCDTIRALGDNTTQTQAPSSNRNEGASIWTLFDNQGDPNTTIEVNKYIWNAAQEVLNFMPVEAADPFSGVLVYGFGTPPGGGQAYRATVYVQDPALDARSLNVALLTRSGPASVDTVRAIEDAILTRARQLRIRDSRL